MSTSPDEQLLPDAWGIHAHWVDARDEVVDATVDVGLVPDGPVAASLADEDGRLTGEVLVLGGRTRSRVAAGALLTELDAFGLTVTDARLDIYPDGGMARLRLFGGLTDAGLQTVRDKWAASA